MMPVQKEKTKISSACSNCRERKVKCSGGLPCGNCVGHGKECFYLPSQRKKRAKESQANNVLEDRLARMEALLHASNTAGLGEFYHAADQFPRSSEPLSSSYISPRSRLAEEHDPGTGNANFHVNDSLGTIGSSHARTQSISGSSTQYNAMPSVESLQSPPNAAPGTSVTRGSVGCSTLSVPDQEKANGAIEGESLDEEEIILPPQKVNWEHHGPGSWLSVCSQPGLRWVCERTGATEFIESAKGLSNGWTRRLKLGRRDVSSPKAPELDEVTAWKYCAAYFETSYDAVFGVIHRPTFESQLRAHFDQVRWYGDEDPSWHAVRNTVYASGCRSVLAKDSSVSFIEAQAQAWSFFENALSVHTEILFNPTGLSAVQALTLMASNDHAPIKSLNTDTTNQTFYVEGLGSPALEYMLCSNAARIAQAKGLHRQPSKSWTMAETEILHLNWLWWAIYCCEKQIVHRSGRPSAIDDDNISCQIPTQIPAGSTIDIEIFTHIIKHAQISSLISKNLMSVRAMRAFQQRPYELISTIHELHRQLQMFRDSLPIYLRPGSAVKKSSSEGLSLPRFTHIVYLHFAYYGSLMAIHIYLFYPWINARFTSGAEEGIQAAFREQVSLSSSTVAEAARNIILTARYLDVDVASPSWLAFYYPMVGVINLFIYILKYPSLPSAQSDCALLDVVAGHFGHLEFMTSSEITFPFPREVSAIAYMVVRKAKSKAAESGKISIQPLTNMGGVADASMTMSAPTADMLNGSANEPDVFDIMDFDMESWNIFSSSGMGGFGGEGEMALFPT